MNAELQAYLDGEKRLTELDGEARAEADAWDRMVLAAREATSSEAPSWIESAVMAQVNAMPAHSDGESFRGWFLRPRAIQVSPLAGLLTAAALAALLVWPRGSSVTEPVLPTPDGAIAPILVEFSLSAPGATSVAVAGDFSEWEARYTLEDVDGDGVWTGRVPVHPGVHEYMFVIDGSDWVTDPGADRYSDDGFGSLNAVLAVGATE